MDINLNQILPLIVPIIVIQLGVQIYALVNLARRKKVRFNSKLLWVLVIIFGEIIGAIVYLVLNKNYEE